MQWIKRLRALTLLFILTCIAASYAYAMPLGFSATQFPACYAGTCAAADIDFAGNRYYIKGTTGALSSLTFARASVATYFDKNGILQTAGSGVPRTQTFNPLTHQALGYLPESSATNLVLQSNTMNVSWTVNGQVTPTAAGILTPDGTNGAWLLTENTSNSVHEIFQTIAHVNGTTYNRWVIAKAGTRNWITVAFFDSVNGSGKYFDLTNGVVGNNVGNAPSNSGIQNLGNGWFLCWITVTAAANNGNVYMGLASANGTNSYLGTSGTVYVYHQQDEVGYFPTSEIVTTTTTVQRATDNLILPVATGSWYTIGAWTAITNTLMNYTTNGNANITLRPWEFSDGTATNRFAMDNASASNQLSGFAEGTNILTGTGNLGAIPLNSVFRGGFRSNLLSYSGVLSGGTINTITGTAVSAPITRILFGNNFSLTAALNNYDLRWTYYPVVLSDTVMQNLTR